MGTRSNREQGIGTKWIQCRACGAQRAGGAWATAGVGTGRVLGRRIQRRCARRHRASVRGRAGGGAGLGGLKARQGQVGLVTYGRKTTSWGRAVSIQGKEKGVAGYKSRAPEWPGRRPAAVLLPMRF